MSPLLKNGIMIFTLLCAILVVVFCVELFLLNRDTDSSPPPVVADNDPDEAPGGDNLDETFPWLDDDFNLGDSATGGNGEGDPTDSAVTPPQGTTRQSFFIFPGVAELVFYVDMELFERSDLGDGIYFSHMSDGNAGLEITFAFVHPQGGISDLAENFLYNYLDGEDANVQGTRTIGSSQVTGIFVTGENRGETFSAWLRSLSDFDSDSLALVVVINYQTNSQRDAIYSILDTMYINMLTESVY